MDWPLAPVSQIKEPRQTGERGLGNGTLNVEAEDRFGGRRPPLRHPEPSVFAHPVPAIAHVAMPDEVDIHVRFVRRPVLLEVEQEVRPVSWKAVAVEVFHGERKAMVKADDGRDVSREFFAEPLGESPPCPVPAQTCWRQNLFRLVGALGDVNPKPFATVLADVMFAYPSSRLGDSLFGCGCLTNVVTVPIDTTVLRIPFDLCASSRGGLHPSTFHFVYTPFA